MATPFDTVQHYTQQRGVGGRTLLREHHYVMLSRAGSGRVYVRDGQIFYEDGVHVPESEIPGWQDMLDALSPAMKETVGLATPQGKKPAPRVPQIQWVYGPEEDQALYIHQGGYFLEDETPISPADLPGWAREAIAVLTPRERQRAGLPPAVGDVIEEELVPLDADALQETPVLCKVCKQSISRADFAQHAAGHRQRG